MMRTSTILGGALFILFQGSAHAQLLPIETWSATHRAVCDSQALELRLAVIEADDFVGATAWTIRHPLSMERDQAAAAPVVVEFTPMVLRGAPARSLYIRLEDVWPSDLFSEEAPLYLRDGRVVDSQGVVFSDTARIESRFDRSLGWIWIPATTSGFRSAAGAMFNFSLEYEDQKEWLPQLSSVRLSRA